MIFAKSNFDRRNSLIQVAGRTLTIHIAKYCATDWLREEDSLAVHIASYMILADSALSISAAGVNVTHGYVRALERAFIAGPTTATEQPASEVTGSITATVIGATEVVFAVAGFADTIAANCAGNVPARTINRTCEAILSKLATTVTAFGTGGRCNW